MFESFLTSDTMRLNHYMTQAATARMTDQQFVLRQIDQFKASQTRRVMIDGEKYFAGAHDILRARRMIIGRDGELEEVKNLPNNRIVDNQYRKMVKQKVSYLLGKPFTCKAKNKVYGEALGEIFNRRFMRLMNLIGRDALNCGIGWLYINYNEAGEVMFSRLKPWEVIPLWKDADHTLLDAAIRIYEVVTYEGQQERVIEKVEVYDQGGIWYFTLDGSLKKDDIPYRPYFKVGEEAYNWSRIPLIPFRYNAEEIPLIKQVKSLQDGINRILSTFQNNMEEEPRNTILVLVNYDGQNLGEFREKLAQYGAVKVRSDSTGTGGDVKTLQVEVNPDNYKVILKLFKDALIENAMGYNAKDDRLGGSPNQMNILSMYSDIDLDADEMETEFQASLEQLLWFINAYFAQSGKGDFSGEEVEIVFNRDILMNEGDIINNCKNSVGIVSDETILANHPWVSDPAEELERLKQQKEENMGDFGFPPNQKPADDPKEGEAPDDEE